MIEKFSDYQKLAITTAIYPKKFKIIYPAFGLIDETVEFVEATEKNIVKELGDSCWYFALLAHELEFDIDGLYEDAIESFKDVIIEDIEDAGLYMISSSAKICGKVKKWLRDEDTKELPSDDKLMDIEFQMINYMAAMLYICGELGVRWQEVAQVNIDKLFDRKDRGKISGSGDQR